MNALTLVSPLDLLTQMPDPDAVRALEVRMRAMIEDGEPEVVAPIQMLIHARICAREMFLPAGTLLTGAQTNIDNILVVAGDVTLTTDSGVRRLTGFNVIPATRGAKRVIVSHADSWMVTLHHTDLTDARAVEDEMTNEADYLQSRRYSEEI